MDIIIAGYINSCSTRCLLLSCCGGLILGEQMPPLHKLHLAGPDFGRSWPLHGWPHCFQCLTVFVLLEGCT